MKRYAASIIFTLTYGKHLRDDDNDLRSVMDIMDSFTRDCAPGAHLVDTFPILDLLPDFLSPWRKDACRKYKKETEVQYKLVIPALLQLTISNAHSFMADFF